MKKNLFTKFLALFLSGTMLASVGCKDYDDDIDGLKGQIEDLKGKIELKADAAALQTVADKIKNVDFSTFVTNAKLSDELRPYLKSSELDAKIKAYGYQTVDQIKDLIKGNTLSEAQIKTLIDTQFGLADIWSKVKGDVEGYVSTELGQHKLTDAQKAEAVAAVLASINVDPTVTDIDDAIANIAGKQFSTHMAEYIKTSSEAWIGNVDTAAAEALKGEQSQLKDGIINLLEAQVGAENIAYLQANDLKTLFDAFNDRFAALEGRIQSLVFVPQSLTESFVIGFAGSDYILDNQGNEVYLGEAAGRSATLKFQVTPASVVTKLNKTNVSVLTEKISRAAAPSFEVTKVEVRNEDDKAKGLFYVDVKTDYPYTDTEHTLAIALNVKMKSTAGDDKQGIDFASAYIPTLATGGDNVSNNLVLGIMNGEEMIEIAPAADYTTEQVWNNKTAHNFFPGVKLYYKDADDNYKPATEKWDNVVFEPKDATTNAVFTAGAGTGVAGDYTLAKTSFTIRNAAQKLIGNTITSGEYVFNMKVGEYVHNIAKIKEVVTIVGTDATYATAAVTATWNYAIATSSDVYALDPVTIKGDLTGETYLEMKGIQPVVTLLNDKNVEVTAPAATLALPSTPDPESTADTKKVELTLTGKLPASGSYTVKAVYTLANKTTVTLTIPVSIEGMPKIDDYSFSATSTYAAGKTEYEVLKDFAKKVWKAAWAPKFFANEAAFIAAVENDMNTTIVANEKATLKINGKNLDAVYTGAEKGKVYTPSIKFTHKTITDLTVTYKASVGIDFPEAKMTTDAAYNDGKPTVVAGFSANDTYKTTGLDLSQIYTYTGSVSGVKVVYTVVDEAAKAKGAQVTSNNILDWGTYTERTIAMKAELKLDTYVLESTEPFDVTLPDPIKDAAIAIDKKKTTLYASKDDAVELDIASVLTLKAANDKNVFSVAANNNNGLDADLYTALVKNRKNAGVTYKLVNTVNPIGIVKYDEASHKVTIDQIVDLQDGFPTVTVNVKVVYTYWFDMREIVVPIEVKPSSAKPAPAN